MHRKTTHLDRQRKHALCELLENRLALSVGATVPYTTYEAESGSYTGTLLGPSYTQNTVQNESSSRMSVRLLSAGQYVQVTSTAIANSLVVRYSIPDSADGQGINSTIGLYINNVFVQKLTVTSKLSWLYGSYPFSNTPSQGSPRNFFDEVRVKGLTINAGDTVRIQRDAADTAAFYDIDLVDMENVAAPLSQPAGNWINVKSSPYNAVGNGVADDTTAIRNAVAAAISQSKNVWVPSGDYKLTGFIQNLHDVTIQGAGMWHTTFVGSAAVYNNSSSRAGFMGAGNNIHLNDFAITGALNYRNDSEPNDGIGDSFRAGSSISNLWIEHTKVGMWIVNSTGLTITDCRFRNTIADGINLSVGMRGNTVSTCTARGNGDDGFAIWPATYISQLYTPGLNVITHCTTLVPFLANGGAIYGGVGNSIDNCLFQDISYGSGVLISTTFPVGGNVFSGTTTVRDSDLVRTGGNLSLAAVQFVPDVNPIPGVALSNLNILESPYSGVGVRQAQTFTATATNLNIPTAGSATSKGYGVAVDSGAVGSLNIGNSTIPDYNEASATFNLGFTNVASGLPVPWLAGDIGAANVKGATSYSPSTFAFNGTGAGIGSTADGFRFMSQNITGDYTFTANVKTLQNTNASAKAGVMFRNDTSPGSVYAGVFARPNGGIAFQWRTASGGATTTVTAGTIQAPVYVRLRRTGDSFSAFYSSDGSTWLQVGVNTNVVMNQNAMVGMAVTSANTSVTAAAIISLPIATSKQFVYDAAPNEVRFTFDTLPTFTAASLTLTRSGGGSFGALSYSTNGNTAIFNVAAPLPDGNYTASLPGGYSFNFFVYSGDADHDRDVDSIDFNIFVNHYGDSGNFSQGDFDYNGKVDTTDFNLLAGNFGVPLPEESPLAVASQVTSPPFGNARINEDLSVGSDVLGNAT